MSHARLALLESDNYGASKQTLELQADDDEYDNNEEGKIYDASKHARARKLTAVITLCTESDCCAY